MAQVNGEDAAHGPGWTSLLQSPLRPKVLDRAQLEDLCSINYTSGSSGRPKGVMLSHRNWLAVCRNMLIDRDIRHADTLAHVGPLTHASGTYFVPWLLRGACGVLIPAGTVDKLLRCIEQQRVTVFTCVPTFLTRLVNYADIDRHDLSSLRAIGYGAEPIPKNTLEKALKRFGPILTQNFGLTEAMMTVTTLAPRDHFTAGSDDGAGELRIGCIGRPYTMVEVVIRAPDGTPVAVGESGELTVRSEHVMQGYWNMPEETARMLREGWLWSGDLARQDACGLITLVGRSKEMIISGGYNIYPQEVEATLTAHPLVIEAAVVGVPDADWGEAVLAFVTPVPGATLDARTLAADCKPSLGLRTPKRFLFLATLPKNMNNKVDKRALKASLALKGESHGCRTPLLWPRQHPRIGPISVDDPLRLSGAAVDRPIAVYSGEEALRQGVTRLEQDSWAVSSHRNYFAAQERGFFSAERMTLTVDGPRKTRVVMDADESPRSDTSLEKLSTLSPVYGGPCITAGNAPGLNDGAAFIALMAPDHARACGLPVLARIRGYAQVCGSATSGTYTPAMAIDTVLKAAGLGIDGIDLIEINEAYAATPLVSTLKLGQGDDARVASLRARSNVNGGAVAIGHPLGASGARLTMTLIAALRERGGGRGVAAIRGGFGQGDALLIEVDG